MALEAAGTASGIISIAAFGIEVCKSLLAYYDEWRSYLYDIKNTYDSIADLKETLALLETTLSRESLDGEVSGKAKECIKRCYRNLVELNERLKELRKYPDPKGFRENLKAELQRVWYPFRKSTLLKIQQFVAEAREALFDAVDVLQLDISEDTQSRIVEIQSLTKETAARTAVIAGSIGQVETQNLSISRGVEDILSLHQKDQLEKIIAWLSPPNIQRYHEKTFLEHEPHTGQWLLQSSQYQNWKASNAGHLWVNGKAGCGKSVLCSIVIEDIQNEFQNIVEVGVASFYFSFQNEQQQSYQSFLTSLLAQLGREEPGSSRLQQEYDRNARAAPGPMICEEILTLCIQKYDKVFILIDALDECPDATSARESTLRFLHRLCQNNSKIKLFLTSREDIDIKDSIEVLQAEAIPINQRSVNIDIGKYVQSQLQNDPQLCKLNDAMKKEVEDIFAKKADGMFLWASCQLRELKKLKGSKPRYFKQALLRLPTTLDESYERMLSEIEDMYYDEALTALRWLAFAERPLSLAELAEAGLIDLSNEGTVDVEDRGSRLEDILDILSGLVTVDNGLAQNSNSLEPMAKPSLSSENDDTALIQPSQNLPGHTKVNFIHQSVRDYLVSDSISRSAAKSYHLREGEAHSILTKSCLTYMLYYTNSKSKTSTKADFDNFPLLSYAAQSWYYHGRLHSSSDFELEVKFLTENSSRLDWLLVHKPLQPELQPFEKVFTIGSPLYFACLLQLEGAAKELIAHGADVNTGGGVYGSPLHAATVKGGKNLVEFLIDHGADINATKGLFGTALHAAAFNGHKDLAEMLIDHGAEINTRGGPYHSPLIAAMTRGHQDLADMLVSRGATNHISHSWRRTSGNGS